MTNYEVRMTVIFEVKCADERRLTSDNKFLVKTNQKSKDQRLHEDAGTHADDHQTRRGEEERGRRHHRAVREEWLPHSCYENARNLQAPGRAVLCGARTPAFL